MAPPIEFIWTILPKSFDGDNVTQGQKFPGKMNQNSSINCISSKDNYEEISE